MLVLRCTYRCKHMQVYPSYMALTLMGVRHLISPMWLEKMYSFSLALSLSYEPSHCHNSLQIT